MKAWNTWERVLLALLVLLLVVFGFAQPGFMSVDTLADSTYSGCMVSIARKKRAMP